MKTKSILVLLGIVAFASADQFPLCPDPSSQSTLTNAACIMAEPTRLYQSDTITNGDCSLTMQGDGLLVLQQSGYSSPVWQSSNDYGPIPDGFEAFVGCQPDANLVVYLTDGDSNENNNIVVWASNSQQSGDISNNVAQLWMSDGSGGFCALFMLWNGNEVWQT